MTGARDNGGDSAATQARTLMRRALKAALATIDRESGHPYASLVTVAALPDGSPLMLLSGLARHTANLEADPRASLLFDGTDGQEDPLQGRRVSVFGRAGATDDPCACARFLARHPAAAMYADFEDFAFYSLAVEGAHFVGGFGSIHSLAPEALLTDVTGASALIQAEPDIVAHMNTDHAEAVELYATRLLGAPEGPWRFAACDPGGCDLVLGDRTVRLDFPARVTTPQGAREVLVILAQKARN